MTRVMLVEEDTYRLMRAALEQTSDGLEVLMRFDEGPRRITDAETLKMLRAARAGEPAPPAVATLVSRRDAAREAGVETREAVEAMLFHLADAGVAPSVLMRWFGYSNGRLFQLLAKRPSAVG